MPNDEVLQAINKVMDAGAKMSLQLKDPYESNVIASLAALGGYLGVIALNLNKIAVALENEKEEK